MKPSIYISYAWGDNPESEEELALEGLCKVLAENGFEVIYDRTYLDYHQSLPAFFKTIGEGGIVIPIVGKKYFTRLNCLIEASNMIIRGDIKERIFPLVLSDISNIYDPLIRPKIISEIETLWKSKEEKLNAAIDFSNELPGSFIPLRKDMNIIKEVIATITPFINHIGTNKQFNFNDELMIDFKGFVEFIINKTTAEIKKPFYQKIEGKYFGRENDIKFLDDFLRDDDKHFLLLFGVGGMGKSHLLSVCLEKFNYVRKFFWIRADKNFELRFLFEKCGLRFPKELIDSKKICEKFLDEFTSKNIFLIIDDFYEIIDTDVRELLTDLAFLPSGKLLIITRAIPKEIEQEKFYNYQILPLEKDDFKKAMLSYITTAEKRKFSDIELDKIFDKAQGYPLGGHLIIRLADFGDKLDEILNDIPKFEAQLDSEGKRFSERLLDNIFKKSKSEEINLLCEFSALIGFPVIDEVRYLPSFKLKNLNTLVNRRKFISKDNLGKYSIHAMIRDYAYEKLEEKEALHEKMGGYFEKMLKVKKEIDWEIAEKAILHFKKVGKKELEQFGQRMFMQFRNRDVKSIVNQSLKNTIRNYNNLIEVYPSYLPYFNELGIAFRKNNQKQNAIDTFLKGLKVKPDNLSTLNELGITYRENIQKTKAIETFERALAIEPINVKVLNELGITYRENNRINKAIETFEKALIIDPNNVKLLNELGITYRENNQKTKAIETFERALSIELNNVAVLNELGITYRENGNIDDAIKYCKYALKIEPYNIPASLNLLQIYLFFSPNIIKFLDYYKIVKKENKFKTLKRDLKRYKLFISKISREGTLNIDNWNDVDNRYIYYAIYYKAYNTVIPLLFELNKKYPNNPSIVSRLGKTLSNKIISRNEEGRKFLLNAIELFKKESNNQQKQSTIIYYFYNLLNQHKMEFLETEIKTYEMDLIHDANYFMFMAHFYFVKNSSIEKAINYFKKAIDISKGLMDKRKFSEYLLSFLSEQNSPLYKKYLIYYYEFL